MENFYLINKVKSRIKVFEPFKIIPKNSSLMNASLISCGYVLKRSSKPIMKNSSVEYIEELRKEYKKLLDESGKNL